MGDKETCQTCGKHGYPFLHSCPGVPQKPWDAADVGPRMTEPSVQAVERVVASVLAEHLWRWASMRCACDWTASGPSLTAAHHAPMTTLQPKPSDQVLAAHRAHVASKVAEALAAQATEGDECADDHRVWREDIAALEADVEMWKQVAASKAPSDLENRVREVADEWNHKRTDAMAAAWRADTPERRHHWQDVAENYRYFVDSLRALLDTLPARGEDDDR